MTESTATVPPRAWRRELRCFAELLALSGFAFAQPLLDIFGRAPDQFIFRGASRSDIIAFALIVTLLVPTFLWVIELGVGAVSKRARELLHIALVGLLATTALIMALDGLVGGWSKVAGGLALGVGFAALYVRTRGAKIWLSYASFAPPMFATIFLLASQVAPLLGGSVNTLGVSVKDPKPVVVIVFDELPLASLLGADGQLDGDLFPNFARLADTSTWFPDATTVSNFTWNAVPAIATGNLPEDGLTPTAADHPNNLFTLLGGAMPVEAAESITRLCPSTVCDTSASQPSALRALLGDARKVMSQRLSPNPSKTDPVAGLVEEAEAGDHTDETEGIGGAMAQGQARFARFSEGLSQPTAAFHYLHLLLPHIPFRYLPDGTSYPGPDPDLGRPTDVWDNQPTLVDLARQRHLLQLQYGDKLLGEALDSLDRSGRFDDALIIATADHGTAFVPGEDIRGTRATGDLHPDAASQIMWVPMFVKVPAQTSGEVSDRHVETIDVLPTVADVLDIELPWKPDGQSMVSGRARKSASRSMFVAEFTGTSVNRGRPATINAEDGMRRVRDAAAGRFAPAVDGATGSDRLFRLGPNPQLWGKNVDDVSSQLTAVEAELGPDFDPSNVNPASGRVPALVRASLKGVSAGDPIAVIVNGRVWATTSAYDNGDGVQVASIVSAEAFKAGNNPTTFARIG